MCVSECQNLLLCVFWAIFSIGGEENYSNERHSNDNDVLMMNDSNIPSSHKNSDITPTEPDCFYLLCLFLISELHCLYISAVQWDYAQEHCGKEGGR